jgi:hypothetical protein
MKPTSHTLATPLLAASFVQAFSGMTIGRHIAAVDNADWADLLARANATSTIAVPFYDVSKNYSSRAQPSLDWEAKLSIVAGVPALGSDDEFFTLTQIELTPPESLRNDNNTYRVKENQWQTCENWLFQVNDRTSEEINPRCEGVLSKDCLESLQALSKLDNCVNVFPDSCQGDSAMSPATTSRKKQGPQSRMTMRSKRYGCSGSGRVARLRMRMEIGKWKIQRDHPLYLVFGRRISLRGAGSYPGRGG